MGSEKGSEKGREGKVIVTQVNNDRETIIV